MNSHDLDIIRKHFPLLNRKINERPIIYFDNAATTLKPDKVIKSIIDFYSLHTANIHRGDYLLSQEASYLYESAREKVAQFIHAQTNEIIFSSGTTDGINTIAQSLRLKPADEIVSTIIEHHSNILPWLNRSKVKYVDITNKLEINFEDYKQKITDKTKLVTLTSCSNVIGIQYKLKPYIQYAKKLGIPVLVDAAQTVGHTPLDVHDLGCDFLVFSGHKICAPSGIGVIYVNAESLHYLTPSKLGGGTVDLVTEKSFVLKNSPACYEAGTPNIEGAIGLGEAIDFLSEIGVSKIEEHIDSLTNYLISKLLCIQGLKVITPPNSKSVKSGIVSFLVDSKNFNNEIVGRNLSDTHNIMVRTGYHCAHILHDKLHLPGTTRVSLYFYNTFEEVDYFVKVLTKLSKLF